jgi:hypothetical protein
VRFGDASKEWAVIEGKVGQFYQVPCLVVAMPFYGETVIPVIGPKHSDPELGATWDHYHIDWRFVPWRMLRAATSKIFGSPHGRVISNDSKSLGINGSISGNPVMRSRKCKRLMPEFPSYPKSSFTVFERAQRVRCDKLKDGHTCPHRGIDLRPFERADGTAICPGHGLHWDLRTGALLRRHDLQKEGAT